MTRSWLAGLAIILLLLTLAGWLGFTLSLRLAPPVDDLTGRVHGRLADHGAPFTPLAQIPPMVQEATIVTEDERFYVHHGIDVIGLARSVLDDMRRRCLCEGGSTLTEQLAKQIYLNGNDASLTRKLESMLLAVSIERHYSKTQILELYLNTVYYGHQSYGVGAAAQTYWHQSVSGLNLAQAAMIAGLGQAPSRYDPLEHADAARLRRSEVLRLLVQSGRISPEQASRANASPVVAGNLLVRDLSNEGLHSLLPRDWHERRLLPIRKL